MYTFCLASKLRDLIVPIQEEYFDKYLIILVRNLQKMMTIVNRTTVIILIYLCTMNLKEKFGKKIKLLREQKKYSIEYLANTANIDRTYISDIEKGKRNVSLLIIEKLANALEVNIKELFEYGE